MHLKAVSRTQLYNSSMHYVCAWHRLQPLSWDKTCISADDVLTRLDAVALLKRHLAAELWPHGCSQAIASTPMNLLTLCSAGFIHVSNKLLTDELALLASSICPTKFLAQRQAQVHEGAARLMSYQNTWAAAYPCLDHIFNVIKCIAQRPLLSFALADSTV